MANTSCDCCANNRHPTVGHHGRRQFVGRVEPLVWLDPGSGATTALPRGARQLCSILVRAGAGALQLFWWEPSPSPRPVRSPVKAQKAFPPQVASMAATSQAPARPSWRPFPQNPSGRERGAANLAVAEDDVKAFRPRTGFSAVPWLAAAASSLAKRVTLPNIQAQHSSGRARCHGQNHHFHPSASCLTPSRPT